MGKRLLRFLVLMRRIGKRKRSATSSKVHFCLESLAFVNSMGRRGFWKLLGLMRRIGNNKVMGNRDKDKT
jgi:hypothetical protein